MGLPPRSWCRRALPALVGAAAALSLAGGVGRAAEVPGLGTWEHYHFSLDPTPTRINLVHEKDRRDFPALKIPRSYIHFVHRGPPSSKGPLPPVLQTDQIKIAFTDPHGQAWSTSLRAYDAQPRTERQSAASVLRSQDYVLTLFPTTNPRMTEDMRGQVLQMNREDGTYEGLKVYRGVGRVHFLPETGEDFILARCSDRIHPVWLCSVQFC